MTDTTHEDEYGEALLEMLQIIWGEGFLSPGGADAIDRILEGCDLRGLKVLDIGSGLGGVDCLLAEKYGARVTGIDIEEDILSRSKAYIEQRGLADQVEVRLVNPGPLPFEDNHFDVVFGKDAWLHVEDKDGFFKEVFRVLKPGGRVICGDWLGGEAPRGEDFDYFLELEGISYHLVTIEEYADILQNAGFSDIWTKSIWEEYREEAKTEYHLMQTELYQVMTEKLGPNERDHFIENWRMLCVVLDQGHLRPALARAQKPL
ncbi:methyltransferase domain-containing protein [Curvivirga aplysinae]|uniref:methyltransferase domain-containing protein n=1 Tax=Curvivirga aplysinae TaxID=2529852 RepID=UPI001C3F6D1B|nr:methyltransferase domain-containing protein [Curvivirga aplysinae]